MGNIHKKIMITVAAFSLFVALPFVASAQSTGMINNSTGSGTNPTYSGSTDTSGTSNTTGSAITNSTVNSSTSTAGSGTTNNTTTNGSSGLMYPSSGTTNGQVPTGGVAAGMGGMDNLNSAALAFALIVLGLGGVVVARKWQYNP